ncbi:GH36-type glycosyl hydrolase domain-containing protein [Xanthobacter sp. YC-JY1]|uniref:GH36-type glycosyl hydrolase domain-containing protein n=1 Tax=Xanthobacter sp. YC-JY1 TaxID=2419844 RepID=UPI001F35C475|nr:glucoamylase family protein [Xanthobacter sp. YC-JY1]
MLSHLLSAFGRAPASSPWDQQPIREELFGAERLEEHARSLASAQMVEPRLARGHALSARLADNGAILLAAYRAIATSVAEGGAITPSAEWLIDNYHLVEKQIREIRSDLPPGYYRQLPKLAGGPFAGYPRVFGVAWAFVAHTDSRFDPEMLSRYLTAYQEIQPLTIGELWAVSITLRIVLIENLRRLAQAIVDDRIARREADALADRLLGAGGTPGEPVESVLGKYEQGQIADAFAVQLVHRLRDQDPRITPALVWLDQRLAAQHTTADTVVRDVHRSQGAANVTIRNIITSLRLISDLDWPDLFERTSLVHALLSAGSAYDAMDFPTRNLYRDAIEQLARGSRRSELDIAREAIAATERACAAHPDQGPLPRDCEPGYYLIGSGRRAFERRVGFRLPISNVSTHLNRAFGVGGYVAAIAIAAAALLALPLLALGAAGVGAAQLVILTLLGSVPAIDAAVALVNRAMSFGFGATALPALELREGVPSHLRTLVAVPTLLTSPASIAENVERLEIHHLASPEGDLHFALLSDWTDSETEHADGDDALLAEAAAGIDALNARYGPAPGGVRFALLHRRRVWNAGEARWIGWERKRGKLHELNRLLRGAADTTFVDIAGLPPSLPADVRYVVTLDADTRLPRDTVRRLIGKMAHPLNRPRFDAAAGRVVEGYGVLQPRVTPSLPMGEEGSLFQRTFSSMSGIDPYGSAVSDVYQDLSGEGSYVGKGIYDVDAFEAALNGRVPDSTLLSHDLFEGVFARAGLASDVEVVEEFPARYDVSALRRHRWARGDWQLLPWILGRGPKLPGATPGIDTMPVMGRWKMLDNLRRSLSAPLAVAALVAGWTLPFAAALFWTAAVLVTLALPHFIPVLAAIVPRQRGIAAVSHLRALLADLRLATLQSTLNVVFLAYEAWLMGDAIVRTLWRLLVTRSHLLEWVPAAQASLARQLDLAGSYRRMAGGLVIAAVAVAVAAVAGEGAWPLAAVFAVAWAASPAVAYRISRAPHPAGQLEMSDAQAQTLRLTARRTWRFFETFVTASDHHLPPDNFQEDPAPVVAHRTSPTNMGLYLLSIASARDFGWLGTDAALGRLEASLATMARLPRFRGHFFNWYDTSDLRPLDPKYVSTVDSGNLAGHLIALANALNEWKTSAQPIAQRLAGIADALDLTREEAGLLADGRRTQTVTLPQLDETLAGLSAGARRGSAEGEDPALRLAELAAGADTMMDIALALATERGDAGGADMLFWARASLDIIASHRQDIADSQTQDAALAARLSALEDDARAMALEMEFGFLLSRDRNLLSIGYLVAEGTLDPSCYDLLASEARLASFFAIAKGDVPAKHWFRLGRSVTPIAHGGALISWSGSMFEYLMPSLIMRAPAGSLLDQTNRLVVRRQIDYAADLRVPWGISESAYNARNLELTYQYSNFGVPGLGLKRGLGDNLVVAPYATALAAMADPIAACANLARLREAGGRGRYGFYEALDYTTSRVPVGARHAVVKAFMAHHQGMTIVAIADTLLGGIMRARFHAEPLIQATELLLQERTPRDVAVVRPWSADGRSTARARDLDPPAGRTFTSARQATPATHLLSNGRYCAMLTAAGSGYSRWGDFAVTRWREDPTCDDYGSYVFIRDVHSGEVWSCGAQPSGVEPTAYHVTFHEDRAEFVRRDGTLETSLDVLVSAEDDAEVRRVSLSNTGTRWRELEITSYAELVLAPQSSDIAHPAFSKLFVETEYLPDIGAILATRRRRSPGEPEIWAAHFSVLDGEAVGGPEIETDRARFLGRGHGVRDPIAVIDGRPLSNTTGRVLDPIFALRRRVRIEPGGMARVAFWTMATPTRSALLDGIDRHRDTAAYSRAATLAWTQAQVELYHLGITASDAATYQRLAGYAIYAAPTLRPSSDTILRGGGPQSGLWAQSISGDLPIVLLRISDIEDIDVAHELLKAHAYWRMKQLAVDLVILNDRQSSYVQDLQIAIEALVRTSRSQPQAERNGPTGRVFVLRADLIPGETRSLLSSIARIVLVAQRGSLVDQLDRISEAEFTASAAPKRRVVVPEPPPVVPELEFFNGLGGFAENGHEYVTVLGPGRSTPAPWINVVANPAFGFHVATEGSGCTWAENSRENLITPWSNDPVTDRSGEAFYLRDDETGAVWTPTALPMRDEAATYVARHGRGYSAFTHAAHGIASELIQFVPVEGSIKIARLKVRNLTHRPRRISLAAYVEWVLGPSRAATSPFVTTGIDDETGALFARNTWNGDFGARVAFLDMAGHQTDWTGDRSEFIGRNGTLAAPAAMLRGGRFSGLVGAGLDPCGAMRTTVDLRPNASAEIVILLGQGADAAEARELIARFRAADLDAVLAEVTRGWDAILGAVEVHTPDRAMDIMLNGWLLYQSLACRVWARSAFYQASGAYGFRDQLQDGMALAPLRPDMTRAHLLRAAGRQFVEGDVQHWWLPHSGRGVRTRISDDRAWLAYATAHYVKVSGDRAVLDEAVPFLEGQRLHPGEHEAFFPPSVSDQSASLFEHCARALDESLALGGHGLPLIGTGDWNDGMNRVGEGGEGESVWLAWFLHAALTAFAPLAEARGEQGYAARWRAHAEGLQAALERTAWDGDWYRRAFFDDGTALGTAMSEECRIDSIAQSWAVLSGAGDPARAVRAMAAVERDLIRPGEGLALLFTPPFDRTPLDPGYIKGYPPGIRENGGQYTHAALWSVMAFATLGEGDKAGALFSMLNPISHARTRSDVVRYKVEPYVLAADIYSEPPHAGRGGWTWYTGSAGWMQRAGIESILGLRKEGDMLRLDPCIPRGWPGFDLTIRHGAARYRITVDNPKGVSRGVASATLDGVALSTSPLLIPLRDEAGEHDVHVRLGS